MFYSVLNISIVIGIICTIIMFLMIPKEIKLTRKGIYITLLAGFMFFLIAWLLQITFFNNNNSHYLGKYTDYTKCEITKNYYSDISEEQWYTFILTYEDGTQLMGDLTLEDDIPFKSTGDYTFVLKNYQGKLIYSEIWESDAERREYLFNTFVKPNLKDVKKETDMKYETKIETIN